jgi:hypothetical protein
LLAIDFNKIHEELILHARPFATHEKMT